MDMGFEDRDAVDGEPEADIAETLMEVPADE